MTDAVPPGGAPGEIPQGSPAASEGHSGASGHDHLRASDADRERVAERLRDAMAEGRLDMAEFEERLDAAYRARTYGELVPITRDLPETGGAAAGATPVPLTKPAAPAGSEANWPARIGAAPTSSWAFAFWSGFQRKGRWTISRLFSAFAIWGGGEIDLREASFEDREVTIRCFALMGGMQVTVPPELNVHISGIGILGGFGAHHGFDEVGHPDAPVVHITGFALLGGVGVERKLARAEKQRLKEERRRFKEDQKRLKGERRAELDDDDRSQRELEGRREDRWDRRADRWERRADHWGRREAHRERRRDARAQRRFGHRRWDD
ncbi:DUF1707 domain-containing protein [Streptomyces odontomachi]|uniref:DUF1707 domain-containing protein n=1 Tax=Streptomyces odontomachi TaxID=2944940 RepID=UPI002108C583|nr:DUF1707 domain-containing protein [Streptomyces sp. ODS25]